MIYLTSHEHPLKLNVPGPCLITRRHSSFASSPGIFPPISHGCAEAARSRSTNEEVSAGKRARDQWTEQTTELSMRRRFCRLG